MRACGRAVTPERRLLLWCSEAIADTSMCWEGAGQGGAYLGLLLLRLELGVDLLGARVLPRPALVASFPTCKEDSSVSEFCSPHSALAATGWAALDPGCLRRELWIGRFMSPIPPNLIEAPLRYRTSRFTAVYLCTQQREKPLDPRFSNFSASGSPFWNDRLSVSRL